MNSKQDVEPGAQCESLRLCGRHHRAAMREARTAVREETFDLLLSDLALPDGTGHEFVAELKAKIPAIALSGLGTPEDQKRSAKAGFSAHLVKPLTLSRLTAAIANAMPAHGAEVQIAPVLH